MQSFYPRAGVRFNPIFTDLQFNNFALDVEDHAEQVYQVAFAAFARAADTSQGTRLERLNFELLTRTGADLVLLYRIARADLRIKEKKVGRYLNLLFWAIIGAAEELLSFEEGSDDWAKDWRSALDDGGLFARVATDLALSGAADGMERDQMIGCLARLRKWVARAREYHFELLEAVPEDTGELVGLAAEAGRLSLMLEEAGAMLRACDALETAAP